MKEKTIYISGKITGLVQEEAFVMFDEAENMFIKKGYRVVNPMKIKHNHDHSWKNYMKTDIKAMMDCDCVYALNNWENSKGATIEVNLAIQLGMEVIYQ